MFSDNAQARPSDFDASEASLRFRMMFAELWHDWFEAMSEVAYQTHRACEFLAENGAPLNRRQSPFDFFRSRGPSEGPNGSLDMDKLQQCLRSMDPMQAAQVMHAVQMMQAMEAILKRRRSRTEETEGAAW
jgi:hypothetical protein